MLTCINKGMSSCFAIVQFTSLLAAQPLSRLLIRHWPQHWKPLAERSCRAEGKRHSALLEHCHTRRQWNHF